MRDGYESAHLYNRRKKPFIGVVIGFDSPRGWWVNENGCWYDCSSEQNYENISTLLTIEPNCNSFIDILEESVDA